MSTTVEEYKLLKNNPVGKNFSKVSNKSRFEIYFLQLNYSNSNNNNKVSYFNFLKHASSHVSYTL